MLHQEFIKCLTTGSWMLRGHVYHFLSPALQKYGYFTVDGVSDSQLNFEVAFENGTLYLYLNVDRESIPGERYQVLGNYCEERLTMIHEILKADESGYEDPTEVIFEKCAAPLVVEEKTWLYNLASNLHNIIRKVDTLISSRVKTSA